MFSAKIWFVKTSTRIAKYESRVVKSNPDFENYIYVCMCGLACKKLSDLSQF